MSRPFISLCSEITRADALTLMDWLEDECVTRHLSDSRHVSRFIEQVIGRVQLPVLTHLFNQGGRFFMAYDRHDVPVGFVRLVKTGPDCEMVLVIGNRDNWGRQLGASAIREGMKLAFFEMRAERLIAKIHPDNARSLKVFQRCGFLLESQTPTLKSFAMTSERYLRRLRESPAGHVGDIHITELDQARLRNLVAFEQAPAVYELEHELERAIVVDPQQVPRDVVTMNSRALLHLDDDDVKVALVYPEDAGLARAVGRPAVLPVEPNDAVPHADVDRGSRSAARPGAAAAHPRDGRTPRTAGDGQGHRGRARHGCHRGAPAPHRQGGATAD